MISITINPLIDSMMLVVVTIYFLTSDNTNNHNLLLNNDNTNNHNNLLLNNDINDNNDITVYDKQFVSMTKT